MRKYEKVLDPKKWDKNLKYKGIKEFGGTVIGILEKKLTSILKPYVKGVCEIYNKVIKDATLERKLLN